MLDLKRPRRYTPTTGDNRQLPIEDQIWIEYPPWSVGERMEYMTALDEASARFQELQAELEEAAKVDDDDKIKALIPEHDKQAGVVLCFRLGRVCRVGIGSESITDPDDLIAAMRQDEELALEIGNIVEGAQTPTSEEVPT